MVTPKPPSAQVQYRDWDSGMYVLTAIDVLESPPLRPITRTYFLPYRSRDEAEAAMHRIARGENTAFEENQYLYQDARTPRERVMRSVAVAGDYLNSEDAANEIKAWVSELPADHDWGALEREYSTVFQLRYGANLHQARKLQAELLGARADADKDGLGSGLYVYRDTDKSFVRIGDAEPLERYHGTAQKTGEIIRKLEPKPGHMTSKNRREIGVTPAVYSTTDLKAALETYGYPAADPEESKYFEGQLYEITVKPDEIADLGDCQNREAARDAIVKGFDVIECPFFWEQPETITFNPDVIQIDAVYRTGFDEEGKPAKGDLLAKREPNRGRLVKRRQPRVPRPGERADVDLSAIQLAEGAAGLSSEDLAGIQWQKQPDQINYQGIETKAPTGQVNPSSINYLPGQGPAPVKEDCGCDAAGAPKSKGSPGRRRPAAEGRKYVRPEVEVSLERRR